MNRLEKYYGLLKDIYGKSIVEAFTVKNKNDSKLTMNNELDNLKAKKDYQRKENEGCITCKAIYRNPHFSKRNLEFPGWIGYLDFSGNTPAKEIMIIGESPPKLKDQINIAFGLGLYTIEDDGKLNFDQLKKIYSEEEAQLKGIIKNQREKNKLWEYLNLLFLNKLDIIKPKIYITDLCKCNDDKPENNKVNKNKDMWEKCLSKCLIEEIKLINPKLIIFQGWSPHTELMKYLKENEIIESKEAIEENVKGYYPKNEEPGYSKTRLYYNPFFSKFPFNGNQIHTFIIFHQSNFTRYKNKYDRTYYINRNLQFIKEKILAEVLNIN